VPNWHAGDKVLIRPGPTFRILAIIDSSDHCHPVWTIELE
jgi:hypothetical protein